MQYNTVEIEKLANLLAANAKFKFDYKTYINKTKKLLIVEGTTDLMFVEHIREDCVDCIVAANVFNSNSKFNTIPSQPVNCKEAIVKVITGVSHFPSPFLKYQDDIDKWDLYGLIDSDCEEIETVRATPRLLITDTHDLETLLLSTDDDLLARIEGCSIDSSDIVLSYYLGYQLALIRSELKRYKDVIELKYIRCGSVQVEFASFIEEDKISIPHLLEYICEKMQDDNSDQDSQSKTNSKIKPASSSKIKTIINDLLACKGLKQKIDKQGNWKQSLHDFSLSIPSDFWLEVNGHDILQLLIFISEQAAIAFGSSTGYKLNRQFEKGLIEGYDYSQFSKTQLYEKMLKKGLVKSI